MLVCVSDTMVSVCMSRCVCVCVSFLLPSFKLSLGCLFSPHHVNQGGVQKTTPLVTLYKPDTAKESLKRVFVVVFAEGKYLLSQKDSNLVRGSSSVAIR